VFFQALFALLASLLLLLLLLQSHTPPLLLLLLRLVVCSKLLRQRARVPLCSAKQNYTALLQLTVLQHSVPAHTPTLAKHDNS
jgi:hypothetical protein